MNQSTTRREAIKTGIGAVGAAMLGSALKGQAAAAQTRPVARAFVTDISGRRHAPFDDALTATGNEPGVSFVFDARDVQQTILGFGAAFTEAACTVLSRLAEADRAALMDELYNPSKTGFSIGRLCVGASDYSTRLYSYDDGPADGLLSRFSIDHDRAAVLPVLRQARGVRSDLFLFASPWSPPGWMKYGDSMLGGSIRPRNLEVYAEYMIRYLKAYHDAGVTVDALTIQNEIDADQYGQMPACTWPEEVEGNYIMNHLGPSLAREKLETQIWMLDHNYDLAGRVLDQLAKASLRRFVRGIAWHGYSGSPAAMASVHARYPEMDTHWTEGGDDISSPTLLTAWGRWADQFAGILNNGARSVTAWNLALDEQGHPNLGPFHCAGLLTVDSTTRAVTRNGIYWALMHYAKAFPRGSRILTCKPSANAAVTAVAASRPDGILAVVVSNNGPAVSVRLEIQLEANAKASQQVRVAHNSVTTVLIG